MFYAILRKRLKMDTKFWLENLKERDRLEDQDVDGRTILQWAFKNIRRNRVRLVHPIQNSTHLYAFVKVAI